MAQLAYFTTGRITNGPTSSFWFVTSTYQVTSPQPEPGRSVLCLAVSRSLIESPG
jgi:hypothetical protein